MNTQLVLTDRVLWVPNDVRVQMGFDIYDSITMLGTNSQIGILTQLIPSGYLEKPYKQAILTYTSDNF